MGTGSVDKTNHAIHWKVIYPVDSIIHFSNNQDQVDSFLILPLMIFPLMSVHCKLVPDQYSEYENGLLEFIFCYKQMAIYICLSVNILFIVLNAETASWWMNYNFDNSCSPSGTLQIGYQGLITNHWRKKKVQSQYRAKTESKGCEISS